MKALKIAIIGIPGKWSTEVLADAIEAKTGFRLVFALDQIMADLYSGDLRVGDIDLTVLDGIIVKKISEVYSPNVLDRIELLRIAEQKGVRIFSKPDSMIRIIDRLACTVTLSNAAIPIPRTRVTEDRSVALSAVKEFGTAVFKPLYSTKARGMALINSDQTDTEIIKQINAFKDKNPMLYVQEKLELNGQDYGLVFLGGRYLGAYARVAQNNSWNTTIQNGGQYAAYEPEQEMIDLACKAQNRFSMDFTTVDMAETSAGPIVFEVSAFGGFKGAKEGIGIDVAERYAEYVIAELNSF